MLGIGWALNLLQLVPKAVAASGDFKHLWDQLVATYDGNASQDDLKAAYNAAVSDAADADMDLQEVLQRHGVTPAAGVLDQPLGGEH